MGLRICRYIFSLMMTLTLIISCKETKIDPVFIRPALSKTDFAFRPYLHSIDFIMHQTIDTVLLGDMNGNGLKDTAFIYSPVFAYEHPQHNDLKGGCENDVCLTTVSFTFTDNQIVQDNAIGFQTLFATEDLNNDGVKEIAFVPLSFMSCWNSIYVYTFRNNEWQLMIRGNVFACGEEDFSHRIKKISSSTFEFRAAKWNEDEGIDIDTTLIFSSKAILPIPF